MPFVVHGPSGDIKSWEDAGARFTDYNGDGRPDQVDLYVGSDWFQEYDSTRGEKSFFDERFERRLDGGLVTDTNFHRDSADAGWRVTSSVTHSATIE